MKRRIAIVSCLYPPNVVAGGTLVPREQALALRASGYETALFVGLDQPTSDEGQIGHAVIDGIPATTITATRWLETDSPFYFENPIAHEEFEEFLESYQPDIVHFHSLQGLGGSLVHAACSHGAATVVQVHDFWWWCDQQFLISTDFKPCTGWGSANCTCVPASLSQSQAHDSAQRSKRLGEADLVLAPCETTAHWVRALGTDGAPVATGGQPHPMAPVVRRIEKPVRSEKFMIVYLGGAGAAKGWFTLLATAQLLWERGYSSKFAFRCVGVPQRFVPRHLRAIIQAQPKATREQMAQHYADADLVVVPSLAAETFGFITREAIHAGVPVVATDGPGTIDFATQQSGVTVVPRGREDFLAAALLDAESASRPHIDEFVPKSQRRLVEELETAYSTAAETRSRRALCRV